MTSRNGEVDKFVRRLEADGWEVSQARRNCHFHVRDPETGALVAVFASSPSDKRSLMHTTKDIRRYLRRKAQGQAA